MLAMVLLALANGMLIALARSLNGRLGQYKGAEVSSSWNHWVGFLVLIMAFFILKLDTYSLSEFPNYALFGGAIGALYVTVNSYVIPKLGATLSGLLVIAGQLLTSLLLDIVFGRLSFQWSSLSITTAGVILILIGLSLSYFSD